MNDQVRLRHHDQQRHVRPAEQHELTEILLLVEPALDEPGEQTAEIEAIGDEAMIAEERGKEMVGRKTSGEIIGETFAVEEVVRDGQKVPGQTAKPRITVHLVDVVADGDDLVEAGDLDGECREEQGDRARPDHQRKGRRHQRRRHDSQTVIAPLRRYPRQEPLKN